MQKAKRTTHRLFWHRRRINCRMWIPKLPSAAKPTKSRLKKREQLLQDAQRQADAIVAEGKAAAEAEHARRLRDANAETSALARDMCEKLLARNLTQQDDARLLDDLLQKAGDSNGK